MRTRNESEIWVTLLVDSNCIYRNYNNNVRRRARARPTHTAYSGEAPRSYFRLKYAMNAVIERCCNIARVCKNGSSA